MEDLGLHNTVRGQGSEEASEDEEENNAGGTGGSGLPGTSGEGDWLSMASNMAEEAAVSQMLPVTSCKTCPLQG